MIPRCTRRRIRRCAGSVRALLSLVALCAAACAGRGPETSVAPAALPPMPSREMRGVWIATVYNIDWPTVAARGDTARAKAELRTLLDRAAADGFNVVVFQVRSGADALYASRLEPWAALLGGTPGVDPGWDPLAFVVDEAHARGLELHAWLNPYRAGSTRDSLALTSDHVFHVRRDLVRLYGGALWMDPGEPDVIDRTLAAITDVVRRYDVDGVHIDDFFYPYPIADSTGRTLDFPDSETFAARNPRGLTRSDWRRDNVNRFVERMYGEVHAAKPWVRVGISPFGIWRPGNPPQIKGLDAYEAIHADSKLWLGRGWLDYFVPQLYWSIDAPAQSFTALLDWWTDPARNPLGRPVWPGLASYRVDTTALRPDSATLPRIADSTTFAYRPGEILRQVRETRARAARGATGVVLYNGSSVLRRVDGALGTRLRDSLFVAPALVPAAAWLGAAAPGAPTLAGPLPGTVVRVTAAAGEPVRWWVVSWHAAGAWTPPAQVWAGTAELRAPAGPTPDGVLVRALSRTGVPSPPSVRWR